MPSFRKYPFKIILLVFCINLLNFPVLSFAGDVVTIGGTGAAIGTMKLIATEFQKASPDLTVRILPSVGSTGAIRAVAQGALDIGLTSRPLNKEEQKLGLSVLEYAKTPFIFITNKSAGVSSFTSDEIVKIYNGETQTWPNGGRIRLVLRPATDSDTLFASSISPAMSSAISAAMARDGMIMALTNQECHDIIVHTPGSIGFSSLTQVITEQHPVKILALNGVAPGHQSLVNRSYPLTKTLSLIVKPEMPSNVRRFVDFIHSPIGRQILEQSGNVAVAHDTK